MAGVWNELRLIFHVVDDQEMFHGTYLSRNHDILDALTHADSQIRTAYARIIGAATDTP